MKTIGQRAEEYISKFREEPKSKEEHIQCVIDFTAGAVSEREELTKWNSPDEPPMHEKTVLLKIKHGKLFYYSLGVYHRGEWNTDVAHNRIIGWREIL